MTLTNQEDSSEIEVLPDNDAFETDDMDGENYNTNVQTVDIEPKHENDHIDAENWTNITEDFIGEEQDEIVIDMSAHTFSCDACPMNFLHRSALIHHKQYDCTKNDVEESLAVNDIEEANNIFINEDNFPLENRIVEEDYIIGVEENDIFIPHETDAAELNTQIEIKEEIRLS